MLRRLMESFQNDFRNNPKLVKRVAIITACVIFAATAGIVISCWTPEVPDPKTASFDKIEDYMASKHYMEMSMADRKVYTATLLERMETQGNNVQTGEIMRRLWEKNRKGATSAQVMAMSQKMAPILSLSDKEKKQRINMFFNMAEMSEGRQKMQEHYNDMFGNTGKGAKNQRQFIKEAVRAMPVAMNSTTPSERRQMIKTIVIAKKQLDRRYGQKNAPTSAPANGQ